MIFTISIQIIRINCSGKQWAKWIAKFIIHRLRFAAIVKLHRAKKWTLDMKGSRRIGCFIATRLGHLILKTKESFQYPPRRNVLISVSIGATYRRTPKFHGKDQCSVVETIAGASSNKGSRWEEGRLNNVRGDTVASLPLRAYSLQSGASPRTMAQYRGRKEDEACGDDGFSPPVIIPKGWKWPLFIAAPEASHAAPISCATRDRIKCFPHATWTCPFNWSSFGQFGKIRVSPSRKAVERGRRSLHLSYAESSEIGHSYFRSCRK